MSPEKYCLTFPQPKPIVVCIYFANNIFAQSSKTKPEKIKLTFCYALCCFKLLIRLCSLTFLGCRRRCSSIQMMLIQ